MLTKPLHPWLFCYNLSKLIMKGMYVSAGGTLLDDRNDHNIYICDFQL